MDVTVLDDLRTRTRAQHRALEDQLKLPQSIASRRDLSVILAADPRVSAAPPPFDTTARAAGGRYVLLGSAIGGRMLVPAIARRLGPGTSAITRFFRRDGLDPRSDWRAFQTAMTSHVWSRRQVEQVVGSARATFEFIAVTARPLLVDGDVGS